MDLGRLALFRSIEGVRGARFVLALLSGVAFASVSPPFDFVSALWVGMAGLAYLLEASTQRPARLVRRLAEGGARGMAFGVGANLVALRFVPDTITRFTPLPWAAGMLALILLAAEQSLRWIAAAWVRGALVRWRVSSPLAFAAGVYAGTFVPVIFPWNPAGGATLRPELLQLADTIGERGVSALMALAAGFAGSALRALHNDGRAYANRRTLAKCAAALALPLVTYVHGRFRMAEVEALRGGAETAKVALVSPSTGATERWDRARAGQILATLTELTKTAEREGVELTIWHETAYPFDLQHDARQAPHSPWTLLQPGVRGPVLAGLVLRRGEFDRFNSAVVAYPDGTVSAPYDKLHLVWFGETVPLANEIPWIRRTFARGLGLTAGEGQIVLSGEKPAVGGAGRERIRAAVLICFEDTLPAAGREAMSVAPNLLVNITNDAWFTARGSADTPTPPGAEETSTEGELHLRMGIMRAIESRRDMVRAVNFGPTAWVDAAGRVRARLWNLTPGVLIANPALLEWPATFYVRFGDVPFAIAVLLTTLVAGFWGTKRQRRQPRASPDADARAAAALRLTE